VVADQAPIQAAKTNRDARVTGIPTRAWSRKAMLTPHGAACSITI